MQFRIIKSVRDINPAHPSKIVRLMRTFDGSVTQLIQSLANDKIILTKIYEKDQPNPQPLSSSPLGPFVLQRLVTMSTKHNNIVCIGRSFWNKESYEALMKGREQMPIGTNLINLRLELFKEIEWYGKSSFGVGDEVWEDVQCRSLRFYNKGKAICQVEEYFTPCFYELFHP